MDALEAPPVQLIRCPSCAQKLCDKLPGYRTLFRCQDCPLGCLKCIDCVLSSHGERPFDRILMWDATKQFWQRITLPQMGYVFNLGHGGRQCMNTSSDPRDMVIIHEHGLMDLPVLFCQCGSARPPAAQLIASGLWPATWERPGTATTLNALEAYHNLSHVAQTSMYDFINHLKDMTDDTTPSDAQDRYREFKTTMRQYTYIQQCRRAGVRPARELPRRSLIVLCPACPQPGINMRERWKERDEVHSYLDALHYSIDGNFHLNMKKKDTDPDDFAYSMGAGYFVHERDFQHFLRKVPPPINESSTCNQFGAMANGKYTGKVTGVIGISCRHMFMLPGGVVDLHFAERYLYVDFCLVSALSHYRELGLLYGTYDIHCQYIKNLRTRLYEEFNKVAHELESIDSAELPIIRAAVGKYHLAMHTGDCRHKHSLHFMPGACMTDGETLERMWAILNALARRTKEMSAGHRHDVLNDTYADMNTRRLQGLVYELVDKHNTAEELFEEAQAYLSELEQSIAPEKVDRWRQEEAEWQRKVVDVRQHKGLDNPFEPPEETALTTQAIAEHLEQMHGAAGEREAVGMLGAMEEVLRLNSTRENLRHEIQTSSRTEKDRRKLTTQLEAFVKQAAGCQEMHARYLQPCISAAIQSISATGHPSTFPRRDPVDDVACGITAGTPVDSDDPATQFLLPSDYHSHIRGATSMTELVNFERELRRGQANEALDDLRLHLTTYLSLEDRKRQVSGVIRNTAWDRRLTKKTAAINAAKKEYRQVRQTLRILGMPEDDEHLQPLEDKDCKPFVIVVEEQQHSDSKRKPTWIWGNFAYIDQIEPGEIKNYLEDCARVHWFQQSARKQRWEEECYVRREEMFRTRKTYHHYRQMWRKRAVGHAIHGKGGAAAYARRQAAQWERRLDAAHRHFPAIIDVVSPL
ncbi:uncharacterized protein TRAVEDRAFT_136413 [Trametes versicolor FP-101664 SS1]|uniref:CxC2-like cysteine cluster KDZ transposase-associated domain-containing protein n=1 Tax=Trametes versicolor (strain FP-101664) TaxID=717944 RepID=R7S8I0_TRAVS|nr:uncharacterized protein TRAVEDRAFT_136413 [Trametes versicolor FP-101664 SS1]EIW51995.1 hypothetical protein TRAVEDRAFT_136413 [Trametes versicolor FP-101664 SS1]